MARKKGPGPMQKAAERQNDDEAPAQRCTRCGASGVALIAVQAPGHDISPLVCQDCMTLAVNEVEGAKPPTGERRLVTEIKYKPKAENPMRIGYDQPHGADTHQIVLECKDEPKASFMRALEALAPHATSLCEIEDELWTEGVRVIGVKIKHSDDSLGAVISCVKRLQTKAVMCFNTPYLPESAEHGPTLPPIVVGCLKTLMDEALDYVDGKRAQGELFTEKEAKDDEL